MDNNMVEFDIDEIDLQWFADDDDDTGNNDEGGHSDEAAAEQAEATAEDDEWGFDDWQEVVGHNDAENDPDAPEGGYNSAWGTDENGNQTYTDYYGNTTQVGWDSDSSDDYNWEFKDPNSVGYEGYTDKNGNWHDSISLHNIGKTAEDAVHSVKGWAEDKANSINLALGGTRAGYTSADFERQQEAEKAKNEWQALADKYKESNPELAKAYQDKADSISLDINKTDTGSRVHNIINNIKEDLGDVGYRVNQFFGGGNEYGLSTQGRAADRNADGKVTFSERLVNMARNSASAFGNAMKEAGKGQLLGLISAGNPLAGLAVAGGVYAGKKGWEALQEYAKAHPATPGQTQQLAVNDNDSSDSSSDDSSSNEPVSTVSIAKQDITPRARNNWTELKLNSLGKNRQSFGTWSGVNDTMGEKTLALSDAHFKDFCLAMITDDPNIRNVLSNKMMMEYFRNI